MEMNKLYLPLIPSRYDANLKTRVPVINLVSLHSHGTIKVLCPTANESRYQRNTDIQAQINELRENISDITLNDFIVGIGDPCLISAAASYMQQICGSVRLLRWSKLSETYDVMEYTL